MIKKRSKLQKHLAKAVLAALVCTGGYSLISPSVAYADIVVSGSEMTLTNISYDIVDTSYFSNVPETYTYYPTSPTYTTVNITGGSTGCEFDGYYSASMAVDVTGHTVNISGGTVGNVNGGETGDGYDSYRGKTSGNTVNITGGKAANVTGGLSRYSYAAGIALVEDNTVNISGDAEVGSVYGGCGSDADVHKNAVNISGGTVSQDVYGGNSAGGNANGNTVTITGGTVGTESGWAGIRGGSSSSGTANNNTVTISGGTINNDIWGGMGATADGNTVTISGENTVFLSTKGIHGAAAMTGDATNNTVNILTPVSVAYLYGGLNEAGGTTKSTGNTLNIAAKNVSTKIIDKFQNMNFYLPSDIANNDTMLTVNGGTETDVEGVTFGVAALSGVKLEKGNTVNLITNPSGLTMDDTLKTTDSATLAKAEFLSANSLTTDDAYELSISKKDANTIIATVDNVTEKKAPEEAVGDILKSPVETRAGVVTLLNAGTDMLVSQGMANAADAAAAERSGGNAAAAPRAGGFAPFAAVGLGNLRAESGSHVDTKSIGLNLGFAREIENKSGKLLVGPVVEYGHGSYDSYQDNGITADGKSSYWGIGVIAKQTNNNGFYYEGSIRAGRTKSDYGSDNVKPGTHVSYDSSATYWALHLGAGKLVDIGHSNTLDYYGKYFYSHTGSDSVFLNGANETANFDAVNSHRIRLGARLTHALNEKNKIYGGLAWQYEFNGDARATYSVSGEAPSPSVKGSSGMIELGWQVKPGKSPMTIDLGVTGWVGKQRGITANVQANWTF